MRSTISRRQTGRIKHGARRRVVPHFPFIALLCCIVAGAAQADPPARMSPVALGDGQVWRGCPCGPLLEDAASPSKEKRGWMLYRCALGVAGVGVPRPVWDFCQVFPLRPEAMAAEGDRLVVVTPPNGSVERMVHLVTFEATNPGGISVTKGSTQGYYRWDVLPPLSHYGTLAQLQMVDGVIFALLNVNPEPTSGSPAWKLLHVQADGSELAWRELALPRLDPDEPFHFFQDSGKLSVLGSVDGHVMVASRPARTGNSDLPWSSTRLENIDDPNFLWNVIGVAHLNGVPLVAHRTGSPKSSQGSTIEVSELRNGYCIQRTTFAEPDGEWTLAGDGKEIALVHVLDGGYVASWLTGDIGKAREDMVIEKSPTGASSAWSLPVLGALAAVVALFGFVAVALVQRQRPRGQPPE